MSEGYSARAIANWFIDRARRDGVHIDHMKLHKLLYYAHGWHLAFTDGEPLITDEFIEAWDYGPVFPSIYQQFKRFGSGPIDSFAVKRRRHEGELVVDIPMVADEAPSQRDLKEITDFLEAVWERYGSKTSIQLSRMTHKPGTPWSAVKEKVGKRRNADIGDDVIRDYFKGLMKK